MFSTLSGTPSRSEDVIMSNHRPLLLSFVGPSNVGTSTSRVFAHRVLERLNYRVVHLDVATPLREIQRFAFKTFGLPDPGLVHTTDFIQDGKLLDALVERFEPELPRAFEQRFHALMVHEKDDVVVINADCRNNSYETLRRLGFRFIRLEAPPWVCRARAIRRGDTTVADATKSSEQTSMIKHETSIDNEDGSLDQLQRNVDVLMCEITARWDIERVRLVGRQ